MAVLSEVGQLALDLGAIPLRTVAEVAQRPDHLGDAAGVVAQDLAVLLEPVGRHRMVRGHAEMLAGVPEVDDLGLGRPFCRSASDNVVTSIIRSDCYRLERQLAGRDSHPLGDGAFPRHTISS